MEPVTHVLTGACLARTGLNRRAAYATVAMAIAAEFPDVDTVWTLRGPVAGFEHHRGITHTFLGVPFEAGFLLLCVYSVHRLRLRTRTRLPARQAGVHDRSKAPVRWGMLYFFLLIALLSHILLDYTNNYGVRPFFPFDPHWFAGSFVFIFDPLIFILLVAGLTLPALFGLISREIGAKKESFRGQGWARAALICVFLLWSVRWFEHSRAVVLAQSQTMKTPGDTLPITTPASLNQPQIDTSDPTIPVPEGRREILTARRSFASPDPFSIFRWYTATDFGPVQAIGVADSRIGSIVPGAIFTDPPTSPSLLVAKRSLLGRIYLDWSPMPVISSEAGSPESANTDPPDAVTTVTFADPRFMGDVPLLHSQGRTPLTGQVVVDAHGAVVAEGMDGRFGR